MSEESKKGCGSCIGTLLGLGFIASVFMGGGIAVRLGPYFLNMGKPVLDSPLSSNSGEGKLSEANKKKIEVALQVFHDRLFQGKCDDIYDQASDALKAYQSKEKFSILCTNFKGTTTHSTEIVEWWGSLVAKNDILIRARTTTSEMSLEETIVWTLKDSELRLINYSAAPLSKSGEYKTPPTPSPSIDPTKSN